MWGLILAIIHGASIKDKSFEVIFSTATDFLFQWYILWFVVYAIVLFVFMILAWFELAMDNWFIKKFDYDRIARSKKGSISFILYVLVCDSLYILGAYFLKNSIVLNGENRLWNIPELVTGSILLVIALKINKGK